MNPRSSIVTIAAGLGFNQSFQPGLRFKGEPAVAKQFGDKQSAPGKGEGSNVNRMSEGSSELNTSARTPQPMASKATAERGRNAATRTIGNRYRKPSETYGFVHQSTNATIMNGCAADQQNQGSVDFFPRSFQLNH
jgi:hypothetical protein